MSEKLLNAALDYANRGWAIVPSFYPTPSGCSCGTPACRVNGKHPRMEHGHRLATIDKNLITKWWLKNPFDNIQIASGSRSRLIVLDIDDRHQGSDSLQFLCSKNGPMPRTLKAITGGGAHYYFKTPSFEVRGRIGMLPGIDIRAEDQLFTAPPSLHYSGISYCWDEKDGLDNAPISSLPEWLLKQILTKNPRKSRPKTTLRKTKSGIELPETFTEHDVFHPTGTLRPWDESDE
jgi:putative DNA primase/helicase